MSIKVIESILPGRNTPIGVGVSMGVDSVAAFLYLRSRGYDVIPIHYNHNLREQNHTMQRKFVDFTRELYKHSNADVSAHCATNITDCNFCSGTEADCRNNRIDYFREVCSLKKIQFIVTAHHLDDCVESYLLNCFRGHPDYQPIKLVSNFIGFQILHPFLLTEKSDFVQFVDRYDNGKYKNYVVVDETNGVNKGSRRNWIRNVIVPELTSQNISLKKFCRERIQQQLEKIVDTAD